MHSKYNIFKHTHTIYIKLKRTVSTNFTVPGRPLLRLLPKDIKVREYLVFFLKIL